DMGDRMEDIVLVTMSEFGRTVKEDGSGGTDHGHGNVMMVLGGPVRGGTIYGRWPGLEPEQLYEKRDLAVTTDFRDVLGELVSHHLGQNMNQVFWLHYGRTAGSYQDLSAATIDRSAYAIVCRRSSVLKNSSTSRTVSAAD